MVIAQDVIMKLFVCFALLTSSFPGVNSGVISQVSKSCI